MSCCGRGRSGWVIVGAAALLGASLLALDHWRGDHDSRGTVMAGVAWLGALTAVFAARSGGCCCRGWAARLLRRRTARVENPYRDVE